MRILYKFPTRERPDKFFSVLNQFQDNIGMANARFLIEMDDDDKTMNNPEIRKRLEEYPNLTYYYGQSKTKVQAINAHIPDGGYDVLCVIADDMIPAFKYFDMEIIKAMKEHIAYFNTRHLALWFADGYQDRINTIPIMTRELYNDFGYVYNPEYTSVYCDNEYAEVLQAQGRIRLIRNVVVIKHEHPVNIGAEQDALCKLNESYHLPDKAIYEARKARNFMDAKPYRVHEVWKQQQ